MHGNEMLFLTNCRALMRIQCVLCALLNLKTHCVCCHVTCIMMNVGFMVLCAFCHLATTMSKSFKLVCITEMSWIKDVAKSGKTFLPTIICIITYLLIFKSFYSDVHFVLSHDSVTSFGVDTYCKTGNRNQCQISGLTKQS